jgi:hypothetical protein
VPEVLQGFYYGEQFLLSDGVPLLDIHQLFAEEAKGSSILADDSSELLAAGVGMHNKRLGKVQVS